MLFSFLLPCVAYVPVSPIATAIEWDFRWNMNYTHGAREDYHISPGNAFTKVRKTGWSTAFARSTKTPSPFREDRTLRRAVGGCQLLGFALLVGHFGHKKCGPLCPPSSWVSSPYRLPSSSSVSIISYALPSKKAPDSRVRFALRVNIVTSIRFFHRLSYRQDFPAVGSYFTRCFRAKSACFITLNRFSYAERSELWEHHCTDHHADDVGDPKSAEIWALHRSGIREQDTELLRNAHKFLSRKDRSAGTPEDRGSLTLRRRDIPRLAST